MPEEIRLGNQFPTQSYILPYNNSDGKAAVKLYAKTKRKAQEWQGLLIEEILAKEPDGLWTHSKFGYSVPRRNGKNEVIAMREMYGLKKGERILHTAHRTTTSHSAWERLCKLLSASGLVEDKDFKTSKKFGLETIEMIGSEGIANFRTRSSKGGLGEGFDLLVIDEAQEYQDDQESALKYVVSDSPNPQTIFCGTPPTPVSSGTVFTKFRNDTLAGKTVNSGWAEWSVEEQTDPQDREEWYRTNPSLGTILTERKILDEIGNDPIDFNIQRLGLWIRYSLKSAISRAEWETLKVDKKPELVGKLFLGVKYGKDGTNVSMSVACNTADGRVFVETLDCVPIRQGNDWILHFLKRADYQKIAIDGQNGQQMLAEEMKGLKLKGIVLPTVQEIIVANSKFEQGLYSGTLCHANQPSLTDIVSNCEKRAIGTKGGFGYRSIKDGVDCSIMDSMILAYWLCSESRDRKKQKISY